MNILISKSALFLFLFVLLSCAEENDPILEPGVVINELMSVNSDYVTDQNGEYDDWIELYNNGDEDIDLTGYFLSDSKSDPAKWHFPDATIIPRYSVLIIWADDDTLQAGLHTNYKLSSDGENVVLSDPDLNRIDVAEYPANILQQSFSRIPNGTGPFTWVQPTFNAINQ